MAHRADVAWPPSRRRLLLGLWAALTSALLVRAFAAGMLRHAATGRRGEVVPVVLDVNRASIAELTALPGIGRGRAEAIVLHRVRYGPFSCIEDLAAVDGIGGDVSAGLRPHVVAEPVTADPTAVSPIDPTLGGAGR